MSEIDAVQSRLHDSTTTHPSHPSTTQHTTDAGKRKTLQHDLILLEKKKAKYMTAATTADKSTKQRNDMVNKMEATTKG